MLLFLLVSATGFSQNLNDYKYAMVPAKFSFLKEENQYNLNLLTKMYLQKYGFETYYNTEMLPTDFAATNCNKIFVDIVNSSNMFTTKLKVVIKDCKNIVLATSQEGTSRDKEYYVAYNEALRMAFDNFGLLKTHKFQESQKRFGINGEPSSTIMATKKTDNLQENINFKGTPATNTIFVKKYNVVATENGYNLITVASDYKIFQIFKTSSDDVYIANRDNVSGILIKKVDSWFFEYYQNKQFVSEKIEVAF